VKGAARPARVAAVAILGAGILAVGCGKKGDPLPPLSSRPARTTDLAVQQRGEAAEISFTFPSQRIDGEPLRDLDRIEIYRLENPSPALTKAGATAGRSDRAPISGERRRAEAERRREQQLIASAQRVAVIGAEMFSGNTRGGQIVYRDALDAILATTHPPTVGYAVVTVRRNRERSEISNIATLALVVPPTAPTDVFAEGSEKRICVYWKPPEKNLPGGPVEVAGYRVYRRTLAEEEFGKPLNANPVDALDYPDTTAAYGSTYVYTVTAVPKDHPSSESSPAIQFGLEYRDTFPPSPVAKLDALPEEHVVRLSWTPVEANDLAGYAVYRSETGGAEVKLADISPTDTSYEDRTVEPDRTYRYVVRAVDRAGNLSAPSPEAIARPFREE
jgi:hypothetical protein